MRRPPPFNPFNNPVVYILPSLHLTGCVATALLDLAWMPVAFSDFPVSALLVGFAWRFGHPLFWFGVFGTIWWYSVSIFFFWLWKY
jgi:hypothetical protein